MSNMSTVNHTVVFVKSSDRSFGNANSFNVAFTSPSSYANVVGIQLLDASIPICYNLQNAYTSGVSFTVASSTIAFSINQGNYAISDLMTSLTTFLMSNFATLETVTCSYSTVTNAITIAWSGAATSLTCTNTVKNGIGYVLGMGITNGASTIGTSNTFTFPGCANLVPISEYIIQVTNMNANLTTTSGFSGMFRVQASANSGSIAFTNNATNVSNQVTFSSPVNNIGYLGIQLIDSNNSLINLSNCEWSFSVGITYLS